MSGIQAAGLVLGVMPLVVSTLERYEKAKDALTPGATKSRSKRLRDLRSVTQLGLSGLALLNVQMRMLGQNLSSSRPGALQYELLETATEYLKASAVVSVVMKERLERAVTTLSTRAWGTLRPDGDAELTVESIREVLDGELLPLNERLTELFDEMSRDSHIAAEPTWTDTLPSYASISGGQEYASRHEKAPDISSPVSTVDDGSAHPLGLEMSRPFITPGAKTEPSSEAADVDEEATVADDGDNDADDTASITTLDAERLGILEKDFHAQAVLKLMEIHLAKDNTKVTKQLLLDTGATHSCISSELSIALGTGLERAKLPRAKSRVITYGNNTRSEVRQLAALTWSFEGRDQVYENWWFYVVDGLPHDVIVGRQHIFDSKFLMENLEICPMGMSAEDSRHVELLVAALGKQEKALQKAQEERNRQKTQQNAQERDAWMRQQVAERSGTQGATPTQAGAAQQSGAGSGDASSLATRSVSSSSASASGQGSSM